MNKIIISDVKPPDFFDGQTEPIIFDQNDSELDTDQRLYPFNTIAQIIKDINTLSALLSTKFEKTIVLIVILRIQSRNDVITFINNHISHQRSIHSFYLFFTEGQRHKGALQASFGPLLVDCYSITNRLYSEIRAALSTACDRNINFCYQRATEEEDQDNKSLALIYERQRRDRVNLQRIYNDRLGAEMDQD
jgi:hypothetical protein